MMRPSSSETFQRGIIFDLDDTLYKEIEFLKSGYRVVADYIMQEYHIAEDPYNDMLNYYNQNLNVFETVNIQYCLPIPISTYLSLYRNHKPTLSIPSDTEKVLSALRLRGCILGIITDGRSITQQNKIHALKLNRLISSDDILISEEFGSEKPDERNFAYFNARYPNKKFTYVGDNPQKDFFGANRLGWETICLLNNGRNIHRQNFNIPTEYLPKIRIDKISQILEIYCDE